MKGCAGYVFPEFSDCQAGSMLPSPEPGAETIIVF